MTGATDVVTGRGVLVVVAETVVGVAPGWVLDVAAAMGSVVADA
ncbi:MAG: hypothetical protein RL430_586, partial [Actinomycetota bacterium]